MSASEEGISATGLFMQENPKIPSCLTATEYRKQQKIQSQKKVPYTESEFLRNIRKEQVNVLVMMECRKKYITTEAVRMLQYKRGPMSQESRENILSLFP